MAKEDLLYMKMRNYLLELIERNRAVPNYKLPSEAQLAIKFGASRISAKHAYQTLYEDGLIYRQQGRGSFIADAHRRASAVKDAAVTRDEAADNEDMIALIVPFTSTIFMSEIINGIGEALERHKMHYILFVTDSDQKREAKYLRVAQESFRGILLFPSDYAKYHAEVLRLVLNHFPLVQIDRYLPGLDLSYVACDHFHSTYRACHALAEKGHERIGFIGHFVAHASSVAERVRGYEQAMREIAPANAANLKLSVDNSLKDFEAIFAEYMRRYAPTALISSSHLHAPVIMRLLKEMGKERDVDLMLYDNEFLLTQNFMAFRPYIIDQPPRLIGQTAAELVYSLAFESCAPKSISLQAQIYRL